MGGIARGSKNSMVEGHQIGDNIHDYLKNPNVYDKYANQYIIASCLHYSPLLLLFYIASIFVILFFKYIDNKINVLLS